MNERYLPEMRKWKYKVPNKEKCAGKRVGILKR
jgi:hypothetical protein